MTTTALKWNLCGLLLELKSRAVRTWHTLFSSFHTLTYEGSKKGSYTDPNTPNAERYLMTYGNMILRLAYSYVHNMQDAEDILQDTLLQVMLKAPTFENSDHERSYLLKCAANISKNRIVYNKVRETDELDETLIAEKREDLSFVWEAVKALPEKYREVIHLFYEEGYKTAEIAQILDRKESTVRSDLKRGRERLKMILRRDHDFE